MPKKKQIVKKEIVTRVTRKKPTKTRGRKNNGRMNISSMNPVVELARSVVNPWSYSACIPDGATGTGCFSVKYDANLATGTGSANFFALDPYIPNAWYIQDSGSANAAPIVTGNWSVAPSNGTITSLYAETRLVSSGIRASYYGPTSSDGGIILVGQVDEGVAASSFNGASLASASALCMYYKVYSLRSGCSITWRPENASSQNGYVATTASVQAVSAAVLRPYLIVAVYGAAASQGTLMLEAIANYEGVFKNQQFLAGGISELAVTQPVVGWYEASKKLYSAIQPILPMFGDGTAKNSKSGSDSVLGDLGTLANGMVGLSKLARSYLA